MKQTINRSQFHDAFHHMGRKDNFSYEGLNHLYDYFEQYEQDCGQEVELDVIAICCEFNEDDLQETLDNYNLSSVEELAEHTSVVWHDDETVIYQVY